MAVIFHIRKPAKSGTRKTGQSRLTLCGAEPTGHDIRWTWHAGAVGDYEPCQKCVEKRRELKTRRTP